MKFLADENFPRLAIQVLRDFGKMIPPGMRLIHWVL